MPKLNKTKYIVSIAVILVISLISIWGLASQVLAYTGLSTGASTLTLGNGENLFYGNIKSDSNAGSNLMLLQKDASASLFRIDSTGGVSIGTTTGLARLSVRNASGGLTPLFMTNNDYVANTSGTSFMFLFGAASGNTTSYLNVNTAGGNSYGDFVINANNIGIGNTNPAHKLSVAGAGYFTSDLYSTTALYGYNGSNSYIGISATGTTQKLFTTSGSTNKNISISPGDSVAMTLLNDGKVGVGITNPSTAQLVVNTGGTYSIDAGSKKIANVAVGSADTDAANVGQLNSAVAGIAGYWKINGTDVYASSTSWDVGIGTTNPSYKLEVTGTSYFSGLMTGAAGLTITGGQVNLNANSGFAINIGTGSNNQPITIGGNSNTLAINTSDWDVSTAGAMTGISGISSDGSYTQSGTSANTFTGTATFSNGTYSALFTGGYVGIGTTTPNSPLHIANNSGAAGQLNVDSLASTSQSAIGISKGGLRYWMMYSPTGASDLRFYADPARSGGVGDIMTLANTGFVAIGTTTMTSAKLSVNYGGSGATIDAGNSRIQNLAVATDLADAVRLSQVRDEVNSGFIATRTGDLNMGGYNVINVNKLTVNTIDPLYNIRGINYSTYAASVAGGVKEEYVGNLKIDTYRPGFGYENVVDFSEIEVGDDLWVWRQVVDFSPSNVQVFITPFGSFAQTYYLIKDNKIVFRSDKPVSVSYRLIGKRFDWSSWPTRALDQKEKAGFIIN